MLENLTAILKPGVTDLILNSAGTVAYRQYGKWASSEASAGGEALFLEVLASVKGKLPGLEKGLAGRGDICERAIIPISNTHRVRIVIVGNRNAESSIEISLRIHPIKSPVKPSELHESVEALTLRKTGLFIVSGAFGKTTYLAALTQQLLKRQNNRCVVVDHIREITIADQKVPVHYCSTGYTADIIDDLRWLSPGVVTVGDEPPSGAIKQRLAVLASQAMVLVSVSGADIMGSLLNWMEDADVSSSLFARVFAGAISVNCVGVGTRFDARIERFHFGQNEGNEETFRAQLAEKQWKLIAPTIAANEMRRNAA